MIIYMLCGCVGTMMVLCSRTLEGWPKVLSVWNYLFLHYDMGVMHHVLDRLQYVDIFMSQLILGQLLCSWRTSIQHFHICPVRKEMWCNTCSIPHITNTTMVKVLRHDQTQSRVKLRTLCVEAQVYPHYFEHRLEVQFNICYLRPFSKGYIR